ncbi:MAG: HD-GYP domain-containing protein [Thermodesulfobacteriota bacterium]
MIKKIRSQDLEVGMFVTDFNSPWLQHPFLTNRKTLRSPRDIQIVLDQAIDEVYIDTARGRDSSKAYHPEEADQVLRQRLKEELAEVAEPATGSPTRQEEEIPFEEELRKAREVYEEARASVQKAFADVRLGKVPDGEQARQSVTKMIESAFRNRDALLSLSRIKSFDDYTLHHCLNVGVLAIHLGAHLGILHEELLRLGIGAILHDLGKVRLPPELVKKKGALHPREFELMKTHAAHGADLMLRCPTIPDECSLVALNHHERYDGSGYPRGLAGLAAGKFGLIAAIADVYDAMTTERAYRRGVTPGHALKRAYEWAGSLLHPIYVRKFIQCLGIYPVGSAVRLDTGETGVVVRQNRDQLLRPWVRVMKNSDGRPLPYPVDRDLRETGEAGDKPCARSIERVLDPRDVGVDPEQALALRSNVAGSERLRVVLG